MNKAIKNNKIIAINDTGVFPLLVYDRIEEDTEHSLSDYAEYNGEYLLKSDIPAPTKEEQSEKRALAYQKDVDPITCHINRLKDEEQTSEIEQEIEELKQERATKVEEIKELYPYPEEEQNNIKGE